MHLTLNKHDDDDIQRNGVIAPLFRAYISSLGCIKIAVDPQEIINVHLGFSLKCFLN